MTAFINGFAKLIIILSLITVFAACGNATPDTPKQTIMATASEMPTLVATFTPKSTLKPTSTLSAVQNYVQKMQDLPEKCKEAFVFMVEPSSHEGKSPDGNWTVYSCFEIPELFIINKDGSKAWHLRHNQLFHGVDNSDSLSIIHWSNDSQYLYLVPQIVQCCWDPNGGTSIDSTFPQLWQFNLNTGNYFNIFENIAPFDSDDYPTMSAISFSPDDKILLVIPQRWVIPPIVYVYDLEKSKVIHSFTLTRSKNSIVAGNVVWSPDGEHFALVSASGGDFEYYQEGEKYKDWQFSVTIIDIKTLSLKVIISESKRDIYLRRITAENILIFESSDPMAENPSATTIDEQYDLTTNHFLTTPTPSP